MEKKPFAMSNIKVLPGPPIRDLSFKFYTLPDERFNRFNEEVFII
jgi:hypothetical protein